MSALWRREARVRSGEISSSGWTPLRRRCSLTSAKKCCSSGSSSTSGSQVGTGSSSGSSSAGSPVTSITASATALAPSLSVTVSSTGYTPAGTPSIVSVCEPAASDPLWAAKLSTADMSSQSSAKRSWTPGSQRLISTCSGSPAWAVASSMPGSGGRLVTTTGLVAVPVRPSLSVALSRAW